MVADGTSPADVAEIGSALDAARNGVKGVHRRPRRTAAAAAGNPGRLRGQDDDQVALNEIRSPLYSASTSTPQRDPIFPINLDARLHRAASQRQLASDAPPPSYWTRYSRAAQLIRHPRHRPRPFLRETHQFPTCAAVGTVPVIHALHRLRGRKILFFNAPATTPGHPGYHRPGSACFDAVYSVKRPLQPKPMLAGFRILRARTAEPRAASWSGTVSPASSLPKNSA